jgi:peptidyl-tRNA hydrolase
MDYVLGKFHSEERPAIDEAIARAVDGVATWVTYGINTAMNQYN